MKNMSEIIKIIEGGLQKDTSKVINYSTLLIEKLEKEGDLKNSKRLINLIKRTKSLELTSKNLISNLIIPVDSESRLPLAEIKQYNENDSFLVLPRGIMEDVNEFIKLITNSDYLLQEDIKVYRSLLLYGPPGTGKNQTAKYISAKTNLPLVTVMMDGMISSYLGSTSKNIRSLFDFVERTPCILFLDEFDAIAKMRDDSNELGELKRVVNTLLQNIDAINSQVPILAATNHEHLLDKAVWRRFDYKIFVDLPKEDQRRFLIKMFLRSYKANEHCVNILTLLTEKMSGGDIEILSDMIKTKVIFDKNPKIDEKLVFDLYLKYLNRSRREQVEDGSSEKSKVILVKSLREKNQKLIDYRTMARLLDCSVGKAHNLMKEESDIG